VIAAVNMTSGRLLSSSLSPCVSVFPRSPSSAPRASAWSIDRGRIAYVAAKLITDSAATSHRAATGATHVPATPAAIAVTTLPA
jgi:hypothetical protein